MLVAMLVSMLDLGISWICTMGGLLIAGDRSKVVIGFFMAGWWLIGMVIGVVVAGRWVSPAPPH